MVPVTLLVILISSLQLPTTECSSAHLRYDMDFTKDCSVGHTFLAEDQIATLHASTSTAGQEVETCNVTFQSPGGFEATFKRRILDDCSIQLSIRSGSTVESTPIETYKCGSSIPSATKVYTDTYLTIVLRKLAISSTHSYDLELELKAIPVETGLSASTKTIIAVCSALAGVVLVVLLVVGCYCYITKIHRTATPPVTYTAQTQMP